MTEKKTLARRTGARAHVGVVALGLWLGPVALGACAVSKLGPPPPAPRADGAVTSLRTVDDARDAFERAEAEVQGMLGTGVSSSEPAPPPGVEPGVRPSPTATYDQTSHASLEERCELACRALGSMARSAERLCELTGEYDDRCRDVRVRVELARVLVHGICPDCSEAR
ncbi:MAG: hypothetical protein HY908_18150 [Myxococcales bacterium]|nr:hypothetical protein [Myxococcales bacterium]